MKALLATALLFLTAACSIGGIGSPHQPSYGEEARPAIGTRSTAAVGDPVYVETKRNAMPGAKTKAPIRWKGGMANMLTANLPPGTVLVRYEADEGSAYCSLEPLIMDALVGPWRQVCLKDPDNNDAFDGLTWLGGIPTSELVPPVPYEVGPVVVNDGKGSHLVLAYSGMEGDTMRLAYREYTGDLSKPAFQQDLTYRYEGPGTKIRFRNVEITVHEVSNDGLTYTVNRGFQS